MRPEKVRVGIVGVGNCASSLVQGLTYYRDTTSNEPIPGLMSTLVGGYRVGDVEIASAFDVAAAKVGRDVAEAIYAPPNNTFRFADVAQTGVDGSARADAGRPRQVSPRGDRRSRTRRLQRCASAERDRHRRPRLLPAGRLAAGVELYAEQALEAGCAFVNCMPVFIASKPEWRARFEAANLPIIGDDIKSQVGATIVHRVLTNLFRERGVRLDRTYQLNFGGNTDFHNMLERERLESKKISKTQAVMSQLDVPLTPENVHVGPSDYVPWLTDRKFCHIRMEGTTFGGVPLMAEVKLEVWDSPNSAGVVIDAVRCAKLALDRGIGGALIGPSSYFMKSPPEQFTDAEARERTLSFIAGGRGAARRLS